MNFNDFQEELDNQIKINGRFFDEVELNALHKFARILQEGDFEDGN
jgi:hypothetical protein